ncbi:hypothetical protein E4U55_007511 [Claviceps digitariae]|nr:hypothetical protein E4U55_007511 [Claviceps digitariae]
MHLLSCAGAIASTLLLLVDPAQGFGPRPRAPPPPRVSVLENELASARGRGTVKGGTFRQLIDHSNPKLGTFSQRYWYNTEWYAGPGAPVVLVTPQEGEGWDGFIKNFTQNGMFGKTNGAAVVTLEHRYFGHSSPYANLTTQNLQHLNLDNAMQDLIYFAKNVVFPFDPKRTSSPDKAPWVLTGCSYAAAVTAWIQRLAPGTFWAYYSSSGVVEAISQYWEYFEPVKAAMPKNCSSDYTSVMKHIDQVLSSGDAKATYALKKRFGLEALSHNNDFGQSFIIPLWLWQSTTFVPDDTIVNPLYQLCDYVENVFPETKEPRLPGPEGVGLEKALAGLARWSVELNIPNCK